MLTRKPQISPLRCAPVEMTILWRYKIGVSRNGPLKPQIPRLPPDFLSRVAASVNFIWFSLRRTTNVVAGESGEVGNPGSLGMTKERGSFLRKVVMNLRLLEERLSVGPVR